MDESATPPLTTPFKGLGRARWLVRGACLAAAAAALWPASIGHPQSMRWVAAVSPFVTVVSLLAGCAFGIAALAALAIAVIASFRRRWFCRWVCPTGLCADVAGRLGRRVGQVANLPVFGEPGASARGRRLSGTPTIPGLTPGARQQLRGCRLRGHLGNLPQGRRLRWPKIGQWLAVATLAGACAGYPLFLWLDPLALLSGAFSLRGPQTDAVGRWTAAGLPAVLLLSLLLPGVWCARLCPLGGTQELLWSAVRVWRPRRAASATSSIPEPGRRLALRAILGAAIGLVLASAVRAARAAVPRPLRPPGAGDEPRFLGLCVRCGNCVRACPAGILSPGPARRALSGLPLPSVPLAEAAAGARRSVGRIAGLLAPVVSFENDYCREDCVRCTEVCPSGALRPLMVKDKLSAPLGLACVNEDLCLLVEGQDCSVCKNHCPLEAISIQSFDDGYTLEPVVEPEKCSGCGACERYCPTSPAKAIVVRPERQL